MPDCGPSPLAYPACVKDQEKLDCFITHFYERFMPELMYRVLKTSDPILDDFYGDAPVQDRGYDDYTVHIRPEYTPEEQDFGEHAIIEEERVIIFGLSIGLMDAQSIDPKIGDVIVFDGDNYEIRTVVRAEESYLGNINVAYEMLAMCNRPNIGY